MFFFYKPSYKKKWEAGLQGTPCMSMCLGTANVHLLPSSYGETLIIKQTTERSMQAVMFIVCSGCCLDEVKCLSQFTTTETYALLSSHILVDTLTPTKKKHTHVHCLDQAIFFLKKESCHH